MSQQIYMNRELSWLKFNERVLEEAENKKVPLCERLTFASIYQSNLDEFFRVRVGSLVDQMLLGGKIRDNKTKMTAKEQIEAVLHQVMKLNRRKDAVYDAIMGQLEDYGIRLVDFRKISKKESEYLEKYFLNEAKALRYILKLYSDRLEDYKDVTIKEVQEDIDNLLRGEVFLDRYVLGQIEIDEEK